MTNTVSGDMQITSEAIAVGTAIPPTTILSSLPKDPPDMNTVTIGDLPADILLGIFELVYSMSREHPKMSYGRDPECEDHIFWKEEDIFSPARFPEGPAAVCRLWRDALSLISIFWTRLVILVDDKPTPLATVRSYLALSCDRPLEIAIIRRPGALPAKDPYEQIRVEAALDLLRPHMSRWKSFRVDVLHYQSIPRPHLFIHGVADRLVDLRLQSKLHDVPVISYFTPIVTQSQDATISVIQYQVRQTEAGHLQIDDHTQSHIGRRLLAPKLAHLWTDGYTFRTAYLLAPSTLPFVRSLTISHYGSTFHNRPTLHKLVWCLRALPHLYDLTLIDVSLQLGQGQLLPLPDFGLRVCTFDNIDAVTLRPLLALLMTTHLSVLKFKRCTIPRWTGHRRMRLLALEEIAASDDVLHSLEKFQSVDLNVTNCPGFNGEVLKHLGTRSDQGNWLCPDLSTLRISSCLAFSSRELADMLSSRTYGCCDIQPRFPFNVYVTGCGELHPQDTASFCQFAENEGFVRWDSQVFGNEQPS